MSNPQPLMRSVSGADAFFGFVRRPRSPLSFAAIVRSIADFREAVDRPGLLREVVRTFVSDLGATAAGIFVRESGRIRLEQASGMIPHLEQVDEALCSRVTLFGSRTPTRAYAALPLPSIDGAILLLLDVEADDEVRTGITLYANALDAKLEALLATERAIADRREAERARALLDGLDLAVFALSPLGLIESWNGGATKLYGFEAEEILGRHVGELHPPQAREFGLVAAELAEVYRLGRLERNRWQERADGSRFWARVTLSTRFDAKGELAGFTAVCSPRQFGFLSEASTLLAASLDLDTALQSVARLAVPFLGELCIVDLIEQGQPIRRAIAHAGAVDATLAEALLLRRSADPLSPLRLGRVLRTGLAHLEADLESKELLPEDAPPAQQLALARSSAMIVPLLARGRALGAITFLSAGQNRRYAADDLAVAEDLARRSGLAIDNARLHHQAQSSIRARDEFLSVASHELKTPLTSLLLQVQGLLRSSRQGGIARLPPDQLQERLRSIERQTRRQARLINELLDVTRISAGRLDLDLAEVDLEKLVREAVSRFQDEAAHAGSAIEIEAPTPVRGTFDPLRLEQVLNNLLSNAIKYGGGRPIRVSVSAIGEQALLTVEDHGLGIAVDEQARIFNRYERASSARNFGGLGLGLFIARTIVEAHEGEIVVASKPGEGSCFTVKLPYRFGA